MKGHIAILLCFFSISSLSTADGYIVDGDNGNDNNDGETINDPFKTITRCVEALANPGDECLIRAGNYHEVVTVTGLQGKTQIARWHTYPFLCAQIYIYLQEHRINHSRLLGMKGRGQFGTAVWRYGRMNGTLIRTLESAAQRLTKTSLPCFTKMTS